MDTSSFYSIVDINSGIDLVLVWGRRLLFADVKSDKGKLTEETVAEVYVWRPSEWDFIEKILQKEER